MEKNLNDIYSVDYFIDKFSKIPEERWCIDEFWNECGAKCAQGHCLYEGRIGGDYEDFNLKLIDERYMHPTNIEFNSLVKLMPDVADINNGHREYYQPTPKQRILAALYDIKRMQEPKERIVYVTVTESIKEQVRGLVMS